MSHHPASRRIHHVGVIARTLAALGRWATWRGGSTKAVLGSITRATLALGISGFILAMWVCWLIVLLSGVIALWIIALPLMITARW